MRGDSMFRAREVGILNNYPNFIYNSNITLHLYVTLHKSK